MIVMYKSGHKDGCMDGIAIMCWMLHEKYGWTKATKSLVEDSIKFIESYMNDDKLVEINDIYQTLSEECGIDFERCEMK